MSFVTSSLIQAYKSADRDSVRTLPESEPVAGNAPTKHLYCNIRLNVILPAAFRAFCVLLLEKFHYEITAVTASGFEILFRRFSYVLVQHTRNQMFF